jgi:plasmid stabilization system protein ParE
LYERGDVTLDEHELSCSPPETPEQAALRHQQAEQVRRDIAALEDLGDDDVLIVTIFGAGSRTRRLSELHQTLRWLERTPEPCGGDRDYRHGDARVIPCGRRYAILTTAGEDARIIGGRREVRQMIEDLNALYDALPEDP